MAVTSKEIRPYSPDARAKSEPERLSFIEWLTPRWGREASRTIEGYVGFSPGMTVACGLMALVTSGIGFGLLFGDGYATIQGVRYLLQLIGLSMVRVDNFPPLEWWTIQVVLVFIQVFAKKIKGMRMLWTPSYIFNATTTAVFIGIGLGMGLGVTFGIGSQEMVIGTAACGAVGALLGHFLALGAEQVTLTGLCMLGAVYSGLFHK
jgi:hypothetical protein